MKLHGYGAFDWGWWKYGSLLVNYAHGRVTSVYRNGVCLYQSEDDIKAWGLRVVV